MKFDNYMGKFASSGDVQTAVDNGDLVKPYVALVEDGNYIDWNTKSIDYSKMPLTIEMSTSGVVSTTSWGWSWRLNNGEWQTYEKAIQNLYVETGDKIQLKGNKFPNQYTQSLFKISGKYRVFGNIMSMRYGDNFFDSNGSLTANAFNYLFQNCTGLTDANNLILPATTLKMYCYWNMFYGCTSLTTAPALPATTLAGAGSCYQSMFENCTSLTAAPALPATTLEFGCYWHMFRGCTSLTKAPELPATTLARYCYNEMFTRCSSLNYIKCLATDISADSCTSNWVLNVAPTGTFVKNASMTSWPTGTSGIPDGWTVQEV